MTPDPKVIQRFKALSWPSLPTSSETLEELELRLWKAAASKSGNPLVYSEWVRGVECAVPRFFSGAPFIMAVEDWKNEYQHVIGDILEPVPERGFLGMEL